MPQMDGIQLCRRVLESNPSVSIIFISGYSDKEYLLSAIQLSAVDYVEKPVSVPRLEAVIEKAVHKRLQAHSIQKNQETALEIVQKNRQIYIDQLVTDLIHGQVPSSVHVSDRESFPPGNTLQEQVPLNDTDFYRIYLWRARTNTMGFKNAMQAIGKLLANSGILPPFFISQKDERSYLFLIRFSSHLACDSQKIDRLLLYGLRRDHMEQSISCSYGGLLQDVRNIRESYNQAVLAMQTIFFSGYGTILPYQENGRNCERLKHPEHTAAEPVSPAAPLTALTEGIRKQDRACCETCLNEFYHACQGRTDILPDMIKNEYFKLISVFVENSPQLTIMHSPDPEMKYLWKHITSLETLEECHRYALGEIEQFFDNLDGIISDKKIILEVMRFIQAHYSDHELYIDQIAKHVHMSPNYLSTLFKKETGKTIGSYLTEIRLEQSCKLLPQTERKLSDIALEVGYTDTNYYSKLFKKYYHMTPSEYRNHSVKK